MELFYSQDIDGSSALLGEQDSAHCVKVLRHRAGDVIDVIDGLGGLYSCEIIDPDPRRTGCRVLSYTPDWGAHPYNLTLAVAPTKNIDRIEWLLEKAVEFGIDRFVPLCCRYSERKVIKRDRLEKIALSATKQSLKAKLPQIDDIQPFNDFVKSLEGSPSLKLIACCFEGEDWIRRSLTDCLRTFSGRDVVVLIGPEGDFSREELSLAREAGFDAVHLGASRLRTETAALSAVTAVYFNYLQ